MLATGTYGTDKAGYAEMLAAGRSYADRVWAVEGCNGIGNTSPTDRGPWQGLAAAVMGLDLRAA